MLLGADINLIISIWSAADRIRKLILRGQCWMVRFHPVFFINKMLTVSEEEIFLRPKQSTSDH